MTTLTLEKPRLRLQRAAAYLRLVRPFNVVMVMAGVVLGGLLVAGPTALATEAGTALLWASVSAALIGGAANALNDFFDLEVDRVNRPRRPLPSGLVAPRSAVWVWGVLSVSGIVLSGWVSAGHVVLAAGAVGLLFAYNARLKQMPGVGNAVVALVLGVALVYGGWAVGPPGAALVGAAFAVLTTLAREVVKDVQDVEGDAAAGMRTLPLAYGPSVAVRLASGVLLVTIVLTPVPFLLLDYSSLYLLLVSAADGLLLRVLWLLQADAPADHAGKASALLKAAMLVGLGALACAGVMG